MINLCLNFGSRMDILRKVKNPKNANFEQPWSASTFLYELAFFYPSTLHSATPHHQRQRMLYSAHHLLSDCGDQWTGVSIRHFASVYVEHKMAMAEAVASLSVAIDWATITITIAAIVICVVEEPVDDATCAGADSFDSIDSKYAVSPDVWQPKEVVTEFRGKPTTPEPEFVEPDQR